jgi:hypothetical protein
MASYAAPPLASVEKEIPVSSFDALLAPVKGADSRELCGVQLDIVRVGDARVKRSIYPAGFRWSTNMKAIVGTDSCMHAHVGFLARGQIHIQYSDGCTLEFTAPQVVSIDPGHDAWVMGDEPAVLIEFDFERETSDRLGVPKSHEH